MILADRLWFLLKRQLLKNVSHTASFHTKFLVSQIPPVSQPISRNSARDPTNPNESRKKKVYDAEEECDYEALRLVEEGGRETALAAWKH